MGNVMNVRGVALLLLTIFIPYSIVRGQSPVLVPPPASGVATMPMPFADEPVAAIPAADAQPAFADVLPPATGKPSVLAHVAEPTMGQVPQSQGLDAILAPADAAPAAPSPVETPAQELGVPPMGIVKGEEHAKVEQEPKDIYLNFDNTELANFINYIAEIKKLNLIPEKGIEGNKISLTIREPLSVEGAWNVFLTVIEMAGFSIVKVGDVYKIIAKDKKVQQPLPAYINVPVDKIPDNDSNIRYVMFLTNLQAAEMKDLVQSMLSDKSSLVDVKDVNGLIITDKCYNIRSAVRVLQELDQMGTTESVTVMRLKTANAPDVKKLLESIIKQPEVSPLARLLGKTAEGGTQFFPPGTRIIAEERTNSLILLGNPKPIKKIEEFIVNHLDTELQDAKSPLHVFELQHTDAGQIAEILQEVTQPGESESGATASKYGAVRGGTKYFKKMNFKVDKDGNRLIVSSTDKVDWKLLKQTIKDLDKPQPQVAIETLIAIVTVSDDKKIGGNVRLKKQNTLGQNIGFQSAATANQPSLEYPKNADGTPNTSATPLSLLGDMISQITSQQGLTTLTFGRPNGGIWSVFSMLRAQTNAAILSQPFITALNKATATVTVGDKRRVLKETSGTGQRGYEDAEANTVLEITPQINIDGVIRMKIRTEINEFEDPEATRTAERKLETNVTLADGQVLVLGGFVKTSVSESKWKTPLLGDLPLLGWFFKSQQRRIAKQYLFIFLSPTIVKPRQQPGMGLYTKMKLHAVTDSVEEVIQTKKLPDPIHNWFFNAEKENYSHKVIDFANARYQPTTVDIKNDPLYKTQTYRDQLKEEKLEKTKVPQKPQEPPVQMPQFQLPEHPSKPLSADVATAVQLEQKRDIMKGLLSAQEEPLPGPAPEVAFVDPAKREQVKELIAEVPTPSSTEAPYDVPVAAEKRSQLQDFIAIEPHADVQPTEASRIVDRGC